MSDGSAFGAPVRSPQVSAAIHRFFPRSRPFGNLREGLRPVFFSTRVVGSVLCIRRHPGEFVESTRSGAQDIPESRGGRCPSGAYEFHALGAKRMKRGSMNVIARITLCLACGLLFCAAPTGCAQNKNCMAQSAGCPKAGCPKGKGGCKKGCSKQAKKCKRGCKKPCCKKAAADRKSGCKHGAAKSSRTKT